MTRKLPILAFAVVLCATTAGAQTEGAPDPEKVRVRFGPFWMNPTLSLANAGIDTNVFNEADADHPKRDFNITVTPQAELWLRMARTWITGLIKEDLVWYNTYSSERSGNSSYTLGWVAPLSRISFAVAGNWLNTRERPGFEIDARSRRREQTYKGAVEVRALSRTFFGVRAERTNVDFAQNALFNNANLHNELNRTSTSGALTLRHELTTLTSVVLDVSRVQDRFQFSTLRDADSTQLTVGLKFNPFALISGSAQVGVRDFVPLSSDLPTYRGGTALLNLTYVAGGSTRLSVIGSRDVQFSYDVNQPYYLQTGVSLSAAQQIYGPIDVEGRFGGQRLAYRSRSGATVAVADRTDHVRNYGAGIGYHTGRDMRVAFNVERQARESGVDHRRYHGLRFGTAITYGF